MAGRYNSLHVDMMTPTERNACVNLVNESIEKKNKQIEAANKRR